MIYAIPPAIRITALGIRGVPTNTVEAARGARLDATADAVEGAAPARAPDAAPVGEPDDPVRALDGRDRRADRRRRASATSSRTGSTPIRRSRSLAGVAIVIMAIALDRATEAMANRTDPTQRHLTEAQAPAAPSCSRSRARPASASPSGLGYALRRRQRPGRAGRARTGCSRRSRASLDYVQDPSTFVFHITSPIGNFLVQYGLSRCEIFFVETPWPATARRPDADRVLRLGAAAGGDHVRDARADRRHRRVDERDGHALAGARRDGLHAARRDPARRLGGREPPCAADDAAGPRRAADAAAARLHHPVHLPDARLDRARASSRPCSTRPRS